jgi:hypothetical protein
MSNELKVRQQFLIDGNIRCLRQALTLVERLDDTHYAGSPPELPDQLASSHLRHVLEFYECFLEGLRRATSIMIRDGGIHCSKSAPKPPF